MTLFDLAKKNIRRNIKSYSLYIGSMVFSIMIYFTFATLKYSEQMVEAMDGSNAIGSLMSVSSVMLLIFVAIFIAYSNSFFIKKRKKEVGLYSLLGIRKRQIGFLLFFENLIIGMFSLLIGIALGFLASKGLLALLMKLMGLEIIDSFSLSSEAIINTFVVFFIIFLLTSLQGYFVIYQFKLIDLFHAEKKGEALPKARFITTLLGIVAIATGYYIASQDIGTSVVWNILSLSTPVVIVLLVIVGTYLLFHSVLVFALSKMKNNAAWAWRGLNLMTVSQMLFRIRGNAKTLTLIAILSATTITAGGAVFGLYYNTEKETAHYAPNTFMWKGNAVDIKSDEILYNETILTKTSEATLFNQMYEYELIAQSTYNNIAQLQGREPITLEANEAFILDSFYDERFSNDYTNEQMTLENKDLVVKGFTAQSPFNIPTIFASAVVPDEVYAQIQQKEQPYQVVKMENEQSQLTVSKQINEQLGDDALFSSFPQMYHDSIQSLGALLFAGSFLGLVFLAATGSIIYFKMITEAEEDRSKYEVLHKVGVNRHEMKKTIRAQVGIVFGVPLILGILHSVFALNAFSMLFNMNIITPVVIWMVAYSCIYAIYYILTVAYFNKTIQQNFTKEG